MTKSNTSSCQLSGHGTSYQFNDIITNSPEMYRIINMCKHIACTDISVLITGESGTGKEIIAQSIHKASSRAKNPFVAINCAALPDSLIESELFGYSSGAFTGSNKEGKIGLFEQAHKGTVFLDEIGELPLHLQSKLLRVLQERQIVPVGSGKVITVDLRIIAATNKNLCEMVKMGCFREDLFYRLNVLPINILPLRDRGSDVSLLLNTFMGTELIFDEDSLKLIHNYRWPGNVREVLNVSLYMKTLMDSNEVTMDSFPHYLIKEYINNSEKNFESGVYEIDFLKERQIYKDAVMVMRGIIYFNSLNMSAGRTHLMRKLYIEGHRISESKLKLILKYLVELELICTVSARKGCRLTERGKKIILVMNQFE